MKIEIKIKPLFVLVFDVELTLNDHSLIGRVSMLLDHIAHVSESGVTIAGQEREKIAVISISNMVIHKDRINYIYVSRMFIYI